MRRTLKTLGWIVAVLFGLPVLLAAGLLLALNTGGGQRAAVRLVNRFAGATVTLDGLSGRFPDALRLARIELRDAHGAYAVITDAALDWAPLRLFGRDAAIRRLAAAEVAVLRLPDSGRSAGTAGGSGAPARLPVRVDLAALHVGLLALAAPVAGVAAVLAVDGTAHLTDLHTGTADIVLRRVDAPGSYHLTGRIDAATLAAAIAAEEPAQGLIAAVAHLPGLGALSLHATLDGPWTGAAARIALATGPLRLDANGRIDITGAVADLDLSASAPAMAPRPDLAWQSVALSAQVHGRFAAPEATATLRIVGLQAAGASIATLSADLAGDADHAQLAAIAGGIVLPGPNPALLAAAPLTLHADADLAAPARPVRFTLAHPLLTLTGTAETAGALRATAQLTLPDLAPLAAAGGADMAGHAAFALTAAQTGADTAATLDGSVAITGGMVPLPALLGPAARISIAAARHGADIMLRHLDVTGSTLTLAAHGGLTGGALALDWRATLADLSAIAATVQGTLGGHGTITGRTDDFAATADLSGDLATAGVARAPISLTLDARGLPDRPTGHIVAHGMLDGAALVLAATAARDADGTLHVAIGQAGWNSAEASGAVTLAPGATLPVGTVALRIGRLADLSRLLGQKLRGSVAATATLAEAAGRPTAHLTLEARDAGLAGTATIGRAMLAATLRDPLADPDLAATLDLAAISAGPLGGNAHLTANGKPASLGLRLTAALSNLAGADLAASSAATLDLPARRVTLSALAASWHGTALDLLAPARISFAGGVAVDRLRFGVQGAVLELAGRVSPTPDLTATLDNATADLARGFVPDLAADGVLTAAARLTGSAARPAGTIHVAATGLHLRRGPGAALPMARLTADATLAGTTAAVTAVLAAGGNRITLAGTAPLDPSAALGLHALGTLDLATLNPLLGASGRRVRGTLRLDATATGSLAAPRATGTLRLDGGDVQDFALGAHVSALTALIVAEGDTLRIARCTGRAGDGTLAVGGTLGLSGTMPVAITLTAQHARPLASDQLTATLAAALTLRGALLGRLDAGGTVTVEKAEIRIPDKLPASVAVLDVRRADAPPPPPAAGPDVGLDLTVTAPGQVFVSGRGLFAELAGRITVGGTAAAPVPDGVFRLRRGSFNLAGTALNFTGGDIRFEGSGTLDPALNLVASSTNGSIIATLTVGGFASAPKITLSSQPPLPQDEILAQLLFRQSAATLSPVQLASAAAALAQISGVGGGVFDPLNTARQQLGLDRLTVGGGQNGTAPTLEAGRYVAPNVYVGARQSADGSGTQATVQIDLWRGLKLETDVGTGSQSTYTGAGATADPYGTSVGLTWQFRY